MITWAVAWYLSKNKDNGDTFGHFLIAGMFDFFCLVVVFGMIATVWGK